MTATRRNHGWEWEAINPKLNRKARVAINQGQCSLRVQGRRYPNSIIPNTERLVVTPLGAARELVRLASK